MPENLLKIHQRHMMNNKDKRKLIQDICNALHLTEEHQLDEILTPKSDVEWIKLDQNQELYVINRILAFWHTDQGYIPLLSFLLRKDTTLYPSVVVDVGAIKFVSKGADVMRPGIIKIDPHIQENDIVIVRDPTQLKSLAVGQALYSAAEMERMDKGKVIHCLHSLIDPIWEFSKSF